MLPRSPAYADGRTGKSVTSLSGTELGGTTWDGNTLIHCVRRVQIKRVTIIGDGKVALAEVPVDGYPVPPDEAPLHDRIDPK